MQPARLARPVTTLRTGSRPPAVNYEAVFLEPRYTDGLPYDTTASARDDEDDDLEAV